MQGDDLVVEGPRTFVGQGSFPGDKSISHRVLLMGAMARGRSVVSNLAEGRDVEATAGLVSSLGVAVEIGRTDRASGDEGVGTKGLEAVIESGGVESLAPPQRVVDCKNSGTTMRMGAGLLAGLPHLAVLSGDASLKRRPMGRVAAPLQAMGAAVSLAPGGTAPMVVRGGRLKGVTWRPEVASAQVKGCLLLAGLMASGTTTVVEISKTREHTETMLAALGARVRIEDAAVSVEGSALRPFEAEIPGDISSAAFFLAGAAASPDSSYCAKGVVATPVRTAFLEVLKEMGARVEARLVAQVLGQPVADIEVGFADGLRGIEIDPQLVPALIDELVVLLAVACAASGTTVLRGAKELRAKESDRIAALATELPKCGAAVEELEDGLVVEGVGGPPRAAVYDSHGDHRVAMALAVLACLSQGRSVVRDIGVAAVSFPGFVEALGEATRPFEPASEGGRKLGAAPPEPSSGRGPETAAAASEPASEKRRPARGLTEPASGSGQKAAPSPGTSTIVSIDGPAGSGKSTVGRMLAERLGVPYLDTGAMYRAITLLAIRSGISPDDKKALEELARETQFSFAEDGRLLVSGRDLGPDLRSQEVDRWVSHYSAVPEVRRVLVAKQRELGGGGAVVEGRDIGTVVFPDATLKVFLDASLQERLRRRIEADPSRDPEEVERATRQRDGLDSSRQDSPLRPASDAVVIDTTDMTAEEVVEAVVEELEKRAGRPWG